MPASIKRPLGGVAAGVNRPAVDVRRTPMATILTQAARAYSARPPIEDMTMPTGFDPAAVALFESLVEAAFLVANAKGPFSAAEREAFQELVADASQHLVNRKQLEALVADLCEMLADDGLEKRVSMVARNVVRPEHQRELLRVAALMAHGAGEAERAVIEQFARELKLDRAAVDEALAQAAEAVKV